MEEKEKKMAAALAAVMALMKSEEEALIMAATAAPAKAVAPAPVNLWGLSGRRDMMQLRNMMQFRSFK